VDALQPPYSVVTRGKLVGAWQWLTVYLMLRLRICGVISHVRRMSSWHIGEQSAENICTQGRGNDRRVEKITSVGTPKFVVFRRCYGNDQMKEEDMDETRSMHGRND